MVLVTNIKIAGFKPIWAPFRGFSLLFDNPGEALTPWEGVRKIDSRVQADTKLSLYQALSESIEIWGPEKLMKTCLFFALPTYSYHVTLWDGINDANISKVEPFHKSALEQYLGGFPGTFPHGGELIEMINESRLANLFKRNIRFKFEKLAIWSNEALVACLTPADELSKAIFDQVFLDRQKLNDHIGSLLNIGMRETYTPHVSLGYFANRESAGHCRKHLREMEHIVMEKSGNRTIAFDAAAVYGFTDMATFFKI